MPKLNKKQTEIMERLADARQKLLCDNSDLMKDGFVAVGDWRHNFELGFKSAHQRAEVLTKTIELMIGMAGNPDAALGCRNIILAAKSTLADYNQTRTKDEE